MKRIPSALAMLIVFAACGEIQPGGKAGRLPEIFPDYMGVTVPVNIAPLDFNLMDSSFEDCSARLTSASVDVRVRAKDGCIRIPASKWESLKTEGDGTIKVTVLGKTDGKWMEYEPFDVYVSKDSVDRYIAYRLIPPGYEVWGEMGIYQRCLESYKQTPIIENEVTGTNCMNCHSFAGGDPNTFLFHMRAAYGGTYLVKDGKVEKLNTKTPETIAALVYPRWSNSGDYVAFSVNDIAQFFHSTDPNRIEVYDTQSDVVVYDVRNHCITFSPLTKSPDWFETFPAFSPDGRKLYFCRSRAVENMPEDYREARYSIVRIDFDPQTCSLGEELEMVYDAAGEGGSASFPRISPDGRYLLVTRMDYGNFPIWHKEADLLMIDLETGGCRSLDAFNSDDADSYHGWSSTGRWVVFSSRRDDGLYTKPYLGHIDADGNADKPFLLPQENPREYYDAQMTSYNLPDFVLDKVTVTSEKIDKVALNDKGTDITVKHQ